MRWNPFRRRPRSASGGEILGPGQATGQPAILSRGHVALSRAAWDHTSHDLLARLNATDGRPAMRPDVTVVERDGSLTEIEGTGP